MDLSKTSAGMDTVVDRLKPGYRAEARRFFRANMGFSEYVDQLDQKYAVATVNKHIAAIKAAAREVFRNPELTDVQKWKLDNELKKVKTRKESAGERAIRKEKILTQEEQESFLTGAPERTRELFRFLSKTGCRVSEALNIKLDHCRETNGKILIRITGKGKKQRTVRLSREFFDELRRTYPEGEHLFTTRNGTRYDIRNVDAEFRRLGIRLIGRPITPHMTRHTFATEMIRRTGKIQAVSEYLGHSTSAITLDMYCHQILEDSDLEA